jgi:hypothetical protein
MLYNNKKVTSVTMLLLVHRYVALGRFLLDPSFVKKA